MMRHVFFWLSLSHAAGAGAFGLDASSVGKSGLTGQQAKALLQWVLKHEKHPSPPSSGTYLEGPFKSNPQSPFGRVFWEFGLTYDSAKAGATDVLGRYAVSKFTGDVWETNLCTRYSFSDLKQIQQSIMLKTGKTLADETEARSGYGCEGD